MSPLCRLSALERLQATTASHARQRHGLPADPALILAEIAFCKRFNVYWNPVTGPWGWIIGLREGPVVKFHVEPDPRRLMAGLEVAGDTRAALGWVSGTKARLTAKPVAGCWELPVGALTRMEYLWTPDGAPADEPRSTRTN
jgi:hypothetical protein